MNDKNMSKNQSIAVALITGAARRIGAEIARTLHGNGYGVIIHCHQSVEDANRLSNEMNAIRPDSAFVVVADLSSRQGCEKIIEQVTFADGLFKGRLDVLINNASAFFPTPFADADETSWQQMFNTNLRAPYILAQKARHQLKQQAGSIVNITDIHGQKPLRNYSIYSMTKAGLISMTQSLSQELAPEIRVNAVSPGVILWPETDHNEDEKQQQILANIPLKKMGTPADIAQTVLFLLQNKFITGQVINVDGGKSL